VDGDLEESWTALFFVAALPFSPPSNRFHRRWLGLGGPAKAHGPLPFLYSGACSGCARAAAPAPPLLARPPPTCGCQCKQAAADAQELTNPSEKSSLSFFSSLDGLISGLMSLSGFFFQVGDTCSTTADCGAGQWCFDCEPKFSGSHCVRSAATNPFQLIVSFAAAGPPLRFLPYFFSSRSCSASAAKRTASSY
jgi:hypothetical protein